MDSKVKFIFFFFGNILFWFRYLNVFSFRFTVDDNSFVGWLKMDSDKKGKRKLKQQDCKKRKKNKDVDLQEAHEARDCELPTKKIRVTEEKQADRAKEKVKKGGEKKKGSQY